MKKQRIQIVSMARAGSSYMTNLVAALMPINAKSHRHYPESFRYDESDKSELPLKNIIEILVDLRGAEFATAKHHACHYTVFQNKSYFKLYNSVPWYSIGVIRTNLFELSLSQSIAKFTQQWNSYNYLEKFIISPELFDDACNTQLSELKRLQLLLPSCNEVVRYEDLTGDYIIDIKKLKIYSGYMQELEAGIGVDRSPNKQEWVANYDELYEYGMARLAKDQQEVDTWWNENYANK